MIKAQTGSGTVLDMLLSLERVTTLGARFLTPSFQETFYPYNELLQRLKRSAATLQEDGLRAGDRAAIILPTSIYFFDAFLGAQMAGGIPTALYPPFRLGKLDEYFARLREMLNRVGARYLITDSRIKKLLGQATAVESLERVIDAKDLVDHSKASAGDWRAVDVDESDPVFLQFSSGTTLKPKAVKVSHVNLVENLKSMGRTFDQVNKGPEPERGAVTWLPLYHDMGLVGCLYNGLAYPATVTYMGPEMFIAQPAMWLQALSRYKAVICTAPNFAYGLALQKIKDSEMEGVDLSNWLLALNGAEPIDTDIMQRFGQRFARWGFDYRAFTPVYGLAEAGLGVTFPNPLRQGPVVTEFDREALSLEGRAERGVGRKLPAVGKPLEGLQLEIRDPDGQVAPESYVGRIFIDGPSITSGYFNDQEMTDSIIGPDGWLNTGDLGFFFEGNLYIAGRAKDLIILRGRNYAPQEFEDPLYELDGLRLGCAVAVSTTVDGQGEQLIVLAEKDARSDRSEEELAADIKSRLLATVSMEPWHVEILEPGTLPRTSSGKMRRSEALRQFLGGELTPPNKVSTLRILGEVAKSQLAWLKFGARKKG